jgi:hypothetical protein
MTKHHYETKQTTTSTDTLIIGTKTGKCDICKATKKILLLRYGFTLCENCLSVCISILEQLQSEATEQISKEKSNAEKEKTNFSKKSQASKLNTDAGRKNKPYQEIETRGV